MDTPASVGTNSPSTTPNQQKTSQGNGIKTFLIIIVIILIAGLGFVSYQLSIKDTQIKSLQQIQPKTATLNQISLPKDAIQISGCLPYMGIHWVRPQDIPHGPYYVTYKGKMTAIEYMYKPDEIPGQPTAIASSPAALIQYMQDHKLSYSDLFKPEFTYDTSGLNTKFWTMTWAPPHAGFTTPHYDMHFYFISKEEANTICPDAKPEEAQTPNIEKELQKYNIPFIPAEQPQQEQPKTQPKPSSMNNANPTTNTTNTTTTPTQ